MIKFVRTLSVYLPLEVLSNQTNVYNTCMHPVDKNERYKRRDVLLQCTWCSLLSIFWILFLWCGVIYIGVGQFAYAVMDTCLQKREHKQRLGFARWTIWTPVRISPFAVINVEHMIMWWSHIEIWVRSYSHKNTKQSVNNGKCLVACRQICGQERN